MMFENLEAISPVGPLDLTLPAIPPRSRLYCFEPVGVGTPEVECLTGYICRLAEEHSVSVHALVCREIGLVPGMNAAACATDGRIPLNLGHGMNGVGPRAEKFVRCLEGLTGRSELSFLTMLPWSQVIPEFGLQRAAQAWCPTCFEESLNRRDKIYIPLMWTFQEVTICVSHRRRLRSECVECGKKVPWLIGSSVCGICPSCKCWLGEADGNGVLADCEIDDEEYERQSRVQVAIGRCLSGASSLKAFPTKAKAAESLSHCIDMVTAGHVRKFGQILGTSLELVSQWKGGKARPCLRNVLEICAHAGITPFDYFTGNVKVGVRLPQKRGYEFTRPIQGRKDWTTIEQQLRDALREEPPPSMMKVIERVNTGAASLVRRFPDIYSEIVARHARHKGAEQNEVLRGIKTIVDTNENPPPSISDVAGRLRTNREFIKKLAPELYEILLNRHKAYKTSIREAAKRSLRGEIRQIAITMHREGNYPSFPKVARCLSSPGRISGEDALNALREVQHELGYR